MVAAGVCDLAIGTDTGGSIRIPAAYCGIVGLKPSYGLVPVDGVFPLSPGCDHTGTLTSTVAGAAGLLAVMAGISRDGGPADAGESDGETPATLGVLAGQLTDPSVTPEVREAVQAALDTLAAAGWQVREIHPPWLDDLRRWERVLGVIVASDAYQVHASRDLSQYAEGTRGLLEYGKSVTPAEYAQAQRERAELLVAVDATLDGVDALAGPTVGYVAPEQDPPFGTGDDHGEGRFAGPYNLTGHPAVSIPVPPAGLPAGLQLAGRRGEDMALLRVAAAVERLLKPAQTASPPAGVEEGN